MATRGRPPGDPWFRGSPWPWLLVLGLLVLGGVAVYLAAATRDEDAERTERGRTATTVTAGETVTVTEEEEPVTVVVPDLVGLNYVEAHDEAQDRDLVADSRPTRSTEPRGAVIAQAPRPGTEVATTSHVALAVSTGPGGLPLARVPDVTGPEEGTARQIAIDSGFTVRTVDRHAPTAEEVGEVILQRPDAGASAPVLTQITLFVGR